MRPLVSIIMPVKNESLYVSDCINSILDQTCSDWELIAVDDHSTDHSLETLKAYQDRHRRINVFQNELSGIIPALNLAQKKASGHFITRMDADDLMPQNRLERMVKMIKNETTPIVVTGLVRYLSDKPVSPGYRSYEKWLNDVNLKGTQWENVYRECVIASPNWMVSLEHLNRIGGFQDMKYPEDYHLVFRWYKHHFKVKTIPETTLLWREHPDRTSRTSSNYNQKAFFDLKIKNFLDIDYNGNPVVVWGGNRKAKLSIRILREYGIAPIHMHINQYKDIEKLKNPQLLIAVYPDQRQQKEINHYLTSIGLKMGKSFWYL